MTKKEMPKQKTSELDTTTSRLMEVNPNDYEAKLTAHASAEKVIILALIDSSFLDMTLNFYETSIERHGITNYLFLASDHRACETLLDKNISCYVYMTDCNANEATVYGSAAFKQKMNIRTFLILDALKMGFTVLHTDVDIVFLGNPLPDLRSFARRDLACLSDTGVCNAGFIYIRPSEFTIDVYGKMKRMALETKLDDQRALSLALSSAKGANKKSINQAQLLDPNKYQCGFNYFESGQRYFADSATCPQCIVVHNNWIVSKEAKRYRFREVLLWSYDENGYYSDETRKYLMYSNAPHNGANDTNSSNVELDALKMALFIGHVLNRVVILPRFHLAGNKRAERPLNNWIKISCFDGQFYGEYRENAFLRHPKVPEKTKRDISSPFWIKTDRSVAVLGYHPLGVTVLTQSGGTKTITEEIYRWFRNETSTVLNFHSIYGLFDREYQPSIARQRAFVGKLQAAFRPTDYRQLIDSTKPCRVSS